MCSLLPCERYSGAYAMILGKKDFWGFGIIVMINLSTFWTLICHIIVLSSTWNFNGISVRTVRNVYLFWATTFKIDCKSNYENKKGNVEFEHSSTVPALYPQPPVVPQTDKRNGQRPLAKLKGSRGVGSAAFNYISFAFRSVLSTSVCLFLFADVAFSRTNTAAYYKFAALSQMPGHPLSFLKFAFVAAIRWRMQNRKRLADEHIHRRLCGWVIFEFFSFSGTTGRILDADIELRRQRRRRR